MTESGFERAQSDNLPKVDMFMVVQFINENGKFVSAEMRGAKAMRSGRDTYGDNAIGYVQLKRIDSRCEVKGRITPEHRVRSKAYSVKCIVNEAEESIVCIECEDCAASHGGCKHAVAFLMWLHRRSEEPAPTDVVSYWKRSVLGGIGTVKKFVKVSELGNRTFNENVPNSDGFLEAIVNKSMELNVRNQLTKQHFDPTLEESCSIHQLFFKFKTENDEISCDRFLQFCTAQMYQLNVCSLIEVQTRNQADCPFWFELRYGRITASKLHEAARCKTLAGSLVESVLGSRKIKDTAAMQRGHNLEKDVLLAIEKKLGKKIEHRGLFLNPDLPVFGASPDGVCDALVVEVKCPSTEKTMSNYITNDGSIASKYLAQIQLQMLMCNKNKGLFCVAHPDFEESKCVTIINVEYDQLFCNNIIENALDFWKKAIFPILNK